MTDAPLILSKTAFAGRRGVSVSAVSKWIDRGHLREAALTADGRINVDEAERQLEDNLDVSRSDGKIAFAVTEAPRAAPPADEPRRPSIRDQLQELDLEQRRRRIAAERGVYVRTEDVRRDISKGFDRFMAAADNWINDAASELGLNSEGLAILRASWRTFREREADAAFSYAETLPEVIADAA